MSKAQRALDGALRPLVAQSRSLVERRLRSARHAATNGAITDAVDDLEELARGLGQLLGDARSSFYLRSYSLQRAELDPDIVDADLVPGPVDTAIARTVPIGRRDQALHIASLVDDAEGELRLGSSVQRIDPATKAAYLQNWELRHAATIASAMHGHLSDAQMSLHNAVGQLLVKV